MAAKLLLYELRWRLFVSGITCRPPRAARIKCQLKLIKRTELLSQIVEIAVRPERFARGLDEQLVS